MKLQKPYFIFYKDPKRSSNPAEEATPTTDYVYILHTRNKEEAEANFNAFVRFHSPSGAKDFRLINIDDSKHTPLRSAFQHIEGDPKPKIAKVALKVSICEQCWENIGSYPLFVDKYKDETGASKEREICQTCVLKNGGSIGAMEDDATFHYNRTPKSTPKSPYRR